MNWDNVTTPEATAANLGSVRMFAVINGSAVFVEVSPIVAMAVAESIEAIPVIDWNPIIDNKLAAALANLGVPKASTLPPGRYELQVDASGNETWVVAGAATGPVPPAPVINVVEGNDIVTAAEAADGVTITGTAEANSTVTVSWGGLNKVATATGGNWSVAYTAGQVPTAGSRPVTATASNANGSGPTATRAVTVESSAPVNTTAPVISGSAAVGTSVTRVAGVWTGAPTITGQWHRNAVEAISGATGAAYTVTTADRGPTRLSYLPYDLYDGGLCPVVATQTGRRYVDPINGLETNDGLTDTTPWKKLKNRTVSNAIIYVIGSGTLNLTGQMATAEAWCQNCFFNNVTIRPQGENIVYIANNVDVDGNQDGSLIYLSSSGAAANNVTIYKIGADGWGTGFYCEGGISNVRFLRCAAKNPTLGTANSNNAHHWYFGYTIGGARPQNVEVAYCEGINTRTTHIGSMVLMYGDGNGLEDIAIHHCLIRTGQKYLRAIDQDLQGTLNADVFCNTFISQFTNGVIEFTNYSTGTAVNSNWKLYSNILVNEHVNRGIIWTQGTHAPNYGGNNTCWATQGQAIFTGTTLAAVGQERNPQLDAFGVAGNTLERGSGSLRTATPCWLGFDSKLPSSTTNVDRGAYQYGPLGGRQGGIRYIETATNSAGTATAGSNIIVVPA